MQSFVSGCAQVVREASRRVLGLRPFDVQLMGGMVLHNGQIAEMRTGEGKTLVAVLPAYLNALSGKGVQVRAQLGQIAPAMPPGSGGNSFSLMFPPHLAGSLKHVPYAQQQQCSSSHMQGWTLRRICLHVLYFKLSAARH